MTSVTIAHMLTKMTMETSSVFTVSAQNVINNDAPQIFLYQKFMVHSSRMAK